MTNEQPSEINRAFADIARILLDADTVDETLHQVVHLAVATVDGCQWAAVSVVQAGGGITTPAASSDLGAQCDGLQYELQEGPCVGAIWKRQTFESKDLRREKRWPRWAPRAVTLGALSLISFRLFVRDDTLGALNLYAGKPGAFDDADRATGAIFASHAAVALLGAQREARRDRAIVIAKATGMLMERRNITSDQAMDLLSRAALRVNLRLADLAQRVVDRRPTAGGPPVNPAIESQT